MSRPPPACRAPHRTSISISSSVPRPAAHQHLHLLQRAALRGASASPSPPACRAPLRAAPACSPVTCTPLVHHTHLVHAWFFIHPCPTYLLPGTSCALVPHTLIGTSHTHWYNPGTTYIIHIPAIAPSPRRTSVCPSASPRASSAGHQRVPLRQPVRLLRGAPACTPPPARAPPPRRTSVYPPLHPSHYQPLPAVLGRSPTLPAALSSALPISPPSILTSKNPLSKNPPPRLSPHPAPPPGPARLLPARSLAAVALRAAHLLRWRSPVVSRGCHAVPFPRQFAS